jgi:hypothetical protein
LGILLSLGQGQEGGEPPSAFSLLHMSKTNRHGSPYSAGRFDEGRLMAEGRPKSNGRRFPDGQEILR